MATVSRAMKYVVLLAGALGVFGFFQPFFVFEAGERTIEASAHTLLVGFDDPKLDPLRYEATPDCVQNVIALDNGSVLDGVSCGHGDKHRSYVPIYFLSAAVFALLALWAIARRRMSALAGVLTLPASFLAIGGWLRELKLDLLVESSHTSTGATMLGLSGIVALGATIVLFVRAEPPRPSKKKLIEIPAARVVR
jgi:hypothetical protein